jgi:hypothetical protein
MLEQAKPVKLSLSIILPQPTFLHCHMMLSRLTISNKVFTPSLCPLFGLETLETPLSLVA